MAADPLVQRSLRTGWGTLQDGCSRSLVVYIERAHAARARRKGLIQRESSNKEGFMQHTSLFAIVATATLLLCQGQLSANPADPLDGTWELNVAKSKFDPGPPPRSQTRTYETKGETVRMTSKGVNAEGKETQVEYTASYDGKDAPITGSPVADAITLKRLDASTTEATLKKGGKVVSTSTRVISSDGKEMTVTTTGTNEKGQPIRSELVFERK